MREVEGEGGDGGRVRKMEGEGGALEQVFFWKAC